MRESCGHAPSKSCTMSLACHCCLDFRACNLRNMCSQTNRRLHAESFAGSMRSHLPAPCGVICRLRAESFACSKRSHLLAQLRVIRLLQAESFAGSAASHLAAPSRAIIPVARIGTPSLCKTQLLCCEVGGC